METSMQPYEREQWEQLDRRLAEAEKKLLATANLVRAGIPMVTSQQMRIDALIDSDARLYLQMQELIESQKRTEVIMAASQKRTDAALASLSESQKRTDGILASLGESQRRTDEKLALLGESHKRMDEVVTRLGESVQKLVDSLKSGGNGSR
jgi:hypothetical protein